MKFYHNPTIRQQLKTAEASVLAGQQTSFIAAQQLLDTYYNNLLAP
jgi:LAO/AO transport system kinase